MRSKFLALSIFIPLSLFSAEENKSVPIYDNLTQFESNKENLDYLLKDSDAKFPVDDYIYKGGKKAATQDASKALKDAQKKRKSSEEILKEEEDKFRKDIQTQLMEKMGANKGNMILDENGKPKLDANGNPMYDNLMYDEFGRPILDANGNPRYKNVMYDKDGRPIYDKNGNLVLKQDLSKVDDKGNALQKDGKAALDANGNQKYSNVLYDENGNPIYDNKGNVALKKDSKKGNVILDSKGKPKLDANGNPMYDNVLYDENGYPLYDENGNLLLKNDPTKGNVITDRNDKPILDANGNPRYSNVLYDENGNPIHDENGKLILKTDPKGLALSKQQEEERKRQEALKAQANGQNPQNYGNGNYSGGGVAYIGGRSINSLIRDSILADRVQDNINFSAPDTRYGVESFSNQKSIDIATNEHRLFRTIRAGRLIPAILTTAISSDIEGIVTAQVEQDVYATMGKAVLIPRGSKVMGFYKNDNKIGQNRIAIVWREIITPQGVNILLTNATTSDNMGMNGALGAVNNKYIERYGVGYGISTISNVLLLALASKTSGNVYSNSVYEQSNKDISTIVEDIIEQQAQIKPTIEIRAGSRIYITPTAHIWFPKPKNGEVMAEFFNDD